SNPHSSMSLNTSTTPDGRGVLVYNGELILLYTKNVVMSFDGNPQPYFKGKKEGALYLTSHRIIFVSGNTGKPFRSFAMPFFGLQNVKLEQPLMGSNYLKGIIQALPDGNYQGEVKWRLSFPKGGCIDFGQALLQAVHIASRQRPTQAPPEYAPTSQMHYTAAAPTYYEAPKGPYYGFVAPTHVFPDRPDGNVYVYDTPPPYPGIAPTQPNVPGGPAPAYPAGSSGYPSSAPAYPASTLSGYAPLPQSNAAPPYPGAPQYANVPHPEAGPLPEKH
ncbi:hypothetical protein PENTCL1PPCAC_29621, partial [Pristionchus entomophagus]